MPVTTATNLDYLIETLRLHLGDITVPYRYLDEWLRTAIIQAVKDLQPWWNARYLLDENYNAYRNTNFSYFDFPEPPVVQNLDEKPIWLMASLIIKAGNLENTSWTLGSWKDAEISYSNLELGRSKRESFENDLRALTDILKPPQKRLVNALKATLPGYSKNQYENGEYPPPTELK